MNIATEYAERLNYKGQNIKLYDRSTDFALKMLTSGYPSHGFVIDKEEASQLFERIEPYPEQLIPAIRALQGRALYPVGKDDPAECLCGCLSGEHADGKGERGEEPTNGGGGNASDSEGKPGDDEPAGDVRGDHAEGAEPPTGGFAGSESAPTRPDQSL